jgi:hypothetical protein
MHELIDIVKVGIFAWVITFLMRPGEVLSFYGKLIDKIKYDFIYKPLGGCNRCCAGQIALYFYLIKYFHSYNFFDHVFFISGVILIVMIFDKLIDYDG